MTNPGKLICFSGFVCISGEFWAGPKSQHRPGYIRRHKKVMAKIMASLEDPTQIEVRGYNISIRKDDAVKIRMKDEN